MFYLIQLIVFSFKDGTMCDENKSCFLRQCIHMQEKASKFKIVNKLTHYYKHVLNVCEFGSTSTKYCNFLWNMNIAQAKLKCIDSYIQTLCCQECLKIKLMFTCESLNNQIDGSLDKCMNDCYSFSSNPCFNDAMCVSNIDGGFYCDCKPGFYGNYCYHFDYYIIQFNFSLFFCNYLGSLCLNYDPCYENPCGNQECYKIGDLGFYYCSSFGEVPEILDVTTRTYSTTNNTTVAFISTSNIPTTNTTGTSTTHIKTITSTARVDTTITSTDITTKMTLLKTKMITNPVESSTNLIIYDTTELADDPHANEIYESDFDYFMSFAEYLKSSANIFINENIRFNIIIISVTLVKQFIVFF